MEVVDQVDKVDQVMVHLLTQVPKVLDGRFSIVETVKH